MKKQVWIENQVKWIEDQVNKIVEEVDRKAAKGKDRVFLAGFVRLKDIVGDPKAEPSIPPILPVSEWAWKKGIKEGKFPKPISFGPRLNFWPIEQIRQVALNMHGFYLDQKDDD